MRQIPFLFTLALLISFSFQVSPKFDKIVASEAANHCACYKSFEKKLIRADKKTRKVSKKGDTKNLFGGSNLEFNLGECLEKKRATKVSVFIDSLSEEQRLKFDKEVIRNVKKNCRSAYQKMSE